MRPRTAHSLVRQRLRSSPVVAVLGARQCGKTTLARALSKAYFDAELPGDRTRLDLEWEQRISGRGLIVIDEAQAWPDLFPRVRAAVDADRRKMGRFLLLGSVSPSLMREVSESLAGRLSLVELTPFLVGELTMTQSSRLWLTGGFPDGGVLKPSSFPTWQRDYATLLTTRDLPSWGLAARPQATQRLMSMLAAVHGQLWNASQLGQSLGLSYHTVNTYLDFLEGAFLIRRLPPWFANIPKRLVKSPKVFIRDSGLLHSLLGITDRRALLGHPQAGASWEGFVIEQVLGSLAARGIAVSPFHFRTSDGFELDLLLEQGTQRIAVEIKLSSQASPEDLDRLDRAANLCQAQHRFIVCQPSRPVVGDHRGVLDLRSAIARFARLLG